MRVPGSLGGPSHPGRVTREGCVANLRYNLDFLLTEERDKQAAKRFLTKAIRRHGVPEKITIDGSAANEAAIKSYNEEHGTAIVIRQIKYLTNIVEIVFAPLTTTRHLAARMGGDDIADFHVTMGHQDPINQEFHQGPLLF